MERRKKVINAYFCRRDWTKQATATEEQADTSAELCFWYGTLESEVRWRQRRVALPWRPPLGINGKSAFTPGARSHPADGAMQYQGRIEHDSAQGPVQARGSATGVAGGHRNAGKTGQRQARAVAAVTDRQAQAAAADRESLRCELGQKSRSRRRSRARTREGQDQGQGQDKGDARPP